MQNNQIIVLETSNIQMELQANDNAIAALRDKYPTIPTEYKALSAAYSEVRQVRLAISKRWENKKKEIKDYRSALDIEAERLINLVTIIENPLKDAKHAIDNAKKAEEEAAAKIEADRIQKILVMMKAIENKSFISSGNIEALETAISELKYLVVDFDFMEFTEKAREIYKKSLDSLKAKLHERKEFEIQQAVLAEEKRKFEEEKAAIAAERAAQIIQPIPQGVLIIDDPIKNAELPIQEIPIEATHIKTIVNTPINEIKTVNVIETAQLDAMPFKKIATFEIIYNPNNDCLEIFHNNIKIDGFPCLKEAFDFTRDKLMDAYKVGFKDGLKSGK